MSVLEIEAPPGFARPEAALRDDLVVLTPAMLGLPARPAFMPATVPAAAGAGTSLWEALRLSWSDPRTKRDLLGG